MNKVKVILFSEYLAHVKDIKQKLENSVLNIEVLFLKSEKEVLDNISDHKHLIFVACPIVVSTSSLYNFTNTMQSKNRACTRILYLYSSSTKYDYCFHYNLNRKEDKNYEDLLDLINKLQ